jgi:hypothetical protein
MLAIRNALITTLKADATIDGLLARTVVAPGTAAAVYAAIPVPQGAAKPYVVVPPAVADTPMDTLDGAFYRDVLIDVHAYADRPDHGGGSEIAIDAITERIRALFHRTAISVTGWRGLIAYYRGIADTGDEEAFGRAVMFEFRQAEE